LTSDVFNRQSTTQCRKAVISGIHLGVYPTQDLHQTLPITSSVLHEKKIPSANGLYDTRTGTSNRNIYCQTCGQSIEQCMGHTAHMQLVKPVPHPDFMKIVFKILPCVCFWCSGCLLRFRDPEKFDKIRTSVSSTKKRLDLIYSASQSIQFCGAYDNRVSLDDFTQHGCGAPQLIYEKNRNISLVSVSRTRGLRRTRSFFFSFKRNEKKNCHEQEVKAEFPKGTDAKFIAKAPCLQPLDTAWLYKILDHITPEDAHALG
jgi:DNA-directed RNA polymerase beta' subunit